MEASVHPTRLPRRNGTSVVDNKQERPLTVPQTLPKAGFFDEDNGNRSAMRLMSFVALMASIMFGGLTLQGGGGSEGLYITFGFLTAAFAPKAVQKFAEQKLNSAT